MTNEVKEAISAFKEWIECDKKIEYADRLENIEIYKLAIKALEQGNVLDKIRAEITEKFDNCSICEWFEDYDYDENDISEYRLVGHISDIIDIIDKYRKGGAE